MKHLATRLACVAVVALVTGGSVAASAQQAPPAQAWRGRMGMMSGDMAAMMSMMQGGGMMGGMPFRHVEGRLAFLKAELKITPAQEPQWNKFADAFRSVAKSAQATQQQMMGNGSQMMGGGPVTAPQRLDRYETMLSTRLDAVRTIKAAFDPLYASLSDEQKRAADELLANPIGPM